MGRNVTLHNPGDVAERVARLPEGKWSEVGQKAMVEYLNIKKSSKSLTCWWDNALPILLQ